MKSRPEHKTKVAKIISNLAKSKSNRGRRSKAQERETLEKGGLWLADVFRSAPLRHPVDPQFAPYYDEVRHGDAGAIIRYCDKYWEQGNLASSFFEMVGRLFSLKFYSVADLILRDLERRPVAGWPSKRQAFGYWYRKLKPLCDRGRDFIRAALRLGPDSTRERLWVAYIAQPAWEIRSEQDSEHHIKRQQAIRSELLEGPESVANRATKQSSESGRTITLVNGFGSFNLLPKEVFFDLALTKFDGGRKFCLTPSAVARKYACQIAGLSESTVGHRKE